MPRAVLLGVAAASDEVIPVAVHGPPLGLLLRPEAISESTCAATPAPALTIRELFFQIQCAQEISRGIGCSHLFET